ncbi:unnamed protein product [Lymnaea stagnalis]|uniref:C1q domain-containing protein n=1 Tax=Lymnaea stagnalis TaxID=6523 RepID=A0AAV2I6J9_LYMST
MVGKDKKKISRTKSNFKIKKKKMASNEQEPGRPSNIRHREILIKKLNSVKEEFEEIITQVQSELDALDIGGAASEQECANQLWTIGERIEFLREKSKECSAGQQIAALDMDTRKCFSSLSRGIAACERRIDDLIKWRNESYEDLNTICMSVSTKCDSLMATIKNDIGNMARKIDQMEKEWVKPSIGFFAMKHCPLPAGDVTEFNAEANYGRHFDPASGRFTAPLHGLYVISLITNFPSNTFYISCILKAITPSALKSSSLCNVYANQSITRCVEMDAGDEIYLKSSMNEQTPEIFVQFSCCLLRRGNI